MASERITKCRICGELFTADARNRKRQKYCPKRTCRAAGKAQRQRRWLAQPRNRDYFRGPEHVQRVREWRAVHPGYWRRDRRQGELALQDALDGQGVDLSSEIERSAVAVLQVLTVV